MPQTVNQTHHVWEVALHKIGRMEVVWRGQTLSLRDHATYTHALCMCGMVFDDLSNRYEGMGTTREHVQWAYRMARLDVAEVGSFLSDAVALWRRTSLPSFAAELSNYAGFKGQLSERYPFVGTVLAPMSGAIDLYLQDPTPASFFPVYQALSFLTHLSLQDLDNQAELEAEYVALEEDLKARRRPRSWDFWMNDPYLGVNTIIREWTKAFPHRIENPLPSHGPGAVAELRDGKSLRKKYAALATDQMLDYVISRATGDLPRTFYPPNWVERSLERTSRVIFVAKSLKTKRVISAEPASLQWFQQMVSRVIDKMIQRHPKLRLCIDLHDQSKQQALALEASETRSFATVDLSAASDSLSFRLVKEAFRGTKLLPLLVGLRSRYSVLPSGDVVALAKFAPMGSALTFPVETLVFAAIAESTIRYVRSTTDPEIPDRFRVYGDDIIIPDQCFHDLVTNLHMFGFKTNVSKSYGGDHRFRESCGCDAFDGVEVTPMKISRKFSAVGLTSWTPGTYRSLIDLANSSQVFGYPTLRRFVIRELNRSRFPVFFTGDDRGCYSPQPTNFHLTVRWNERWQCEEKHAGAIHSLVGELEDPKWDPHQRRYIEGSATGSRDGDDVRYFEWLRSTYNSARDPLRPVAIISRGNWSLFAPVFPCDGAVTVTRIGSTRTWLGKRWMREWDCEVPHI